MNTRLVMAAVVAPVILAATPLCAGVAVRQPFAFAPAAAGALDAAHPSAELLCSSGPGAQYLCVGPGSAAAGATVSVAGYAPACSAVRIVSVVAAADQSDGLHAAPGGQFRTKMTVAWPTPRGTYTVGVSACGADLDVRVDFTVL